MPPQDGGWLNNSGQTEQARPPSGHPNHQGTVTCPKPDTLWGSPQGDVELMAEKKVLPTIPNAKELISLRIDRDILDHFQEDGPGWQDRINEALRKLVGK